MRRHRKREEGGDKKIAPGASPDVRGRLVVVSKGDDNDNDNDNDNDDDDANMKNMRRKMPMRKPPCSRFTVQSECRPGARKTTKLDGLHTSTIH